ncbi:MAG: M20 family metallopeptidase, partial [Candidatus Staskawiczbacteria bacterium]
MAEPSEHKESTEPLPQLIVEKAKELGPEMEKLYADFHENPELGGEERETSQKIINFLQSIGVEIVGKKIGLGTKDGKRPRGYPERSEGTGVVAIIKGREGGPTIALRADMDALPVQENKSHSPCSKKENLMHGCGHDTHTTALLGAAEILKELAGQGKLEGNVVLIFQPSEEKAHQKESGAVQIVKFLQEQGLRNKINAFFGLHVHGESEKGEIMVKSGVQFASSGELDVILRGPGGHVINIYDQPDLQNIFSRINVELKDTFEPLYKDKKALVGSTRTKYAGSGYNVLPAEAESTWVVRVADPLYRQISKGIVEKIRVAVDKAVQEEIKRTGGPRGYPKKVEVDIKRRHGYRPVIHRDPELVDIAEKAAKDSVQGYKGNKKELIMGGEDFSFYLEKFRGREIPGVFVMVGGANPEKGFPKSSHHSPD